MPGWYSGITVELDIDCLAINTLLQSHHVTDIEGTSAATAFDASVPVSLEDLVGGSGAASLHDETVRCAEAFRILRTMASVWMRDISVYRNVYADYQVVHFYRCALSLSRTVATKTVLVSGGCGRRRRSCTTRPCCARSRI